MKLASAIARGLKIGLKPSFKVTIRHSSTPSHPVHAPRLGPTRPAHFKSNFLAVVRLNSFTAETEFTRFVNAVRYICTKAIKLFREASNLVKPGMRGDALKRDLDTIELSMRKHSVNAEFAESLTKLPPAATKQETHESPKTLLDSLSDETLQLERESREETPDMDDARYSKILRSADGSIIRTGVKSTPARAARNSYVGFIPGVETTWIGTQEDFDAEFPDGYQFDDKTNTPPADAEALVAKDGRAFIFIDRVQVVDGDLRRAEAHGTSPSVEATKRLLRHESFIHRGFMSLPGPLKACFADFVASGIIPEAELDYLVNNGYTQYAGWRNSKATAILAAEEWLAQRAERMGRIPQSGPIACIMDWLSDVWRWLTGGQTTDLDKLRNTMRAMHKALGALGPNQPIRDPRTSSPHHV